MAHRTDPPRLSRRRFLGSSAAAAAALAGGAAQAGEDRKEPALIAITLDLEMSRDYPERGMLEWDYQKGNLDQATKRYAVEAARLVRRRGGVIHFFCVGRVLEQENVDWLRELAAEGHPVGNHTYDHVNVKATRAEECQFRFQRSPWLVAGRTARDVIYENIRMTTLALNHRTGIDVDGFRTPGGFDNGLADRPDVRQMLLDLGFPWVSSLYPRHLTGREGEEPSPEVYDSIVRAQAHAQPFVYADGLIEIPMSPISDVTAFRSGRWKLAWFLKAIRLAVERTIEAGGVFDFLGHPSCLVVEDPRFESLALICDLVCQAGDRARLVGLGAIAERTGPSAT